MPVIVDVGPLVDEVKKAVMLMLDAADLLRGLGRGEYAIQMERAALRLREMAKGTVAAAAVARSGF